MGRNITFVSTTCFWKNIMTMNDERKLQIVAAFFLYVLKANEEIHGKKLNSNINF